MKKVLIGILIFAALVILAFSVFKWYIAMSTDQIRLQYTDEVTSELKRELDFSPFKVSIQEIGESRMEELQTIIESKSALEIQEVVMSGEITNEELVLAQINRIEKFNDDLKAIIQLNPKVLEQARAIDEKFKKGHDVGALFGITVVIKDNIASENMNTSSGADVLRGLTTDRDAYIVSSMKSEDALILAKANLSEWSNYMSFPSSNGFSVLGGQTKNPYGKFDVGGSSSGSSVAAAASFSSVTIGTETAGSLIFPAGQNSVVALKPTMGSLSRDLIIPISEAQDTAGVIAKTVKDVAAISKAIIEVDSNDPQGHNAISVKLGFESLEFDETYLSGKRIGYVKSTQYPTEQVEKDFKRLGAVLVPVEIDDQGIDMMTVMEYGIVHDVEAFLNHSDVNSSVHSLKEVLDYNNENPESRMPFGAGDHESALESSVGEEEYKAVVKKNREISSAAMDKVLKEHDLDAILSYSNELAGVYAPAMYPAVTVPAGYKGSGEPFGITIVGSLNSDAELLKLAYAYEQGTLYRKNPVLNVGDE